MEKIVIKDNFLQFTKLLEYEEKLVINPYFMTLAGVGAGRRKYFNNVLLRLNISQEAVMLSKGKGYWYGIPDIIGFVFLRKLKKGRWLHGKQNFSKMSNAAYHSPHRTKFHAAPCHSPVRNHTASRLNS